MAFLDHLYLVRIAPVPTTRRIPSGQDLDLGCKRKVDHNVGLIIAYSPPSDGPRRRVTERLKSGAKCRSWEAHHSFRLSANPPTIAWNGCPSSRGSAAHDQLEWAPIIPWNTHRLNHRTFCEASIRVRSIPTPTSARRCAALPCRPRRRRSRW
jgi:hypothetical protein